MPNFCIDSGNNSLCKDGFPGNIKSLLASAKNPLPVPKQCPAVSTHVPSATGIPVQDKPYNPQWNLFR